MTDWNIFSGRQNIPPNLEYFVPGQNIPLQAYSIYFTESSNSFNWINILNSKTIIVRAASKNSFKNLARTLVSQSSSIITFLVAQQCQ